ncbi:MAG: hypothetical protein IKZ47_01285 [Clostridia bacterium]|nr:hypothetical protein [Clostridia bacterium]
MMILPFGKNDDAPVGRNDAMCSVYARSAHHEAKPLIMPEGLIMFRDRGTHHSPSVLLNTQRGVVLFNDVCPNGQMMLCLRINDVASQMMLPCGKLRCLRRI